MGWPRWKAVENRVAKFFGTVRRPLSGRNSCSGGSDDIIHDKLYVECKSGKYIPLFRLYQEVKRKSRSEGDKIPVIVLDQQGSQGFLIVVHSSDLVGFARVVLSEIHHGRKS